MTNQEKVKELVNNNKIVTVQDFMIQKRDLISKALPSTITPERLIGIFEMVIKSSPKLAQCSQKSLISAVIQTAQLGLQPGNIGHIHLIPFKNKGILEAQLRIGYKGYVELVNRSGKATIFEAEVVYSRDIFEYEKGLYPILRHIPAQGDRGFKIGVYCIAKNLIANEKIFVYLQKEEVEKIKKSARSSNTDYSPWTTWPDEMWKKSAVKRISKLLPISTVIQSALSADETIKHDIDRDMANVPDKTDWEDREAEDAEVVKEEKDDDKIQPDVKETKDPYKNAEDLWDKK